MGWWDRIFGGLFKRKPHRPPPPPANPMRAVAVTAFTAEHTPVEGATVTIDNVGPNDFVGVTNGAGYVEFREVPVSLGASQLTIVAQGYKPYVMPVHLAPVNHILRVGDKAGGPADIELPPLQRAMETRPYGGTVRVEGVTFATADRGWFFPVFAPAYVLPVLFLRDQPRAEAYMDWMIKTGFNGARFFGGAINWPDWKQTPQESRAGLAALLPVFKRRGLYATASALTDTAITTYDHEAHVREIGAMAQAHGNLLVEIANEPYHATAQAGKVHDFNYLAQLARLVPPGVPVALGAPLTDEPSGELAAVLGKGSYVTTHLDRGGGQVVRGEWDMVRRCHSFMEVIDKTKRASLNNEPIGWNEVAIPGRRNANPAIAFAMGALSRLFGSGLVSHAEHGLRCQMPGPVQQRCHEEVIAGVKSVAVPGRLHYSREGLSDAPIAPSGLSGDGPQNGVLKVFAGIQGNAAYVMAVGLAGPGERGQSRRTGTEIPLTWINRWQPTGAVQSRPGFTVIEARRT